MKNICKKAGQKLSALLRISSYVEDIQTKLIYNAMIKPQFNYCPLIWMFCSKKSNKLIKTQERALKLACMDNTKNFQFVN